MATARPFTCMLKTVPFHKFKVNGASIGLRSKTMYFHNWTYIPEGYVTMDLELS